jgi:CheY-like chemotaxis protein
MLESGSTSNTCVCSSPRRGTRAAAEFFSALGYLRRPIYDALRIDREMIIEYGLPLMNLMIVDDNEQMRRIIRSIISDLVEELYECEDGEQAVALYAERRPDWVVMDIRMKEMDGLEATRRIIARFPQARIVIVTDYDDRELREAAREAGACQYINKRRLFDLRLLLSPQSNLNPLHRSE